MSRVVRVILGALVLLLPATNMWAQSIAQINGTVADSSGAVVPGATVIVVQTDTGFRREVVADDKGTFTMPNLPIGPYRLEVSLAGFRSYVQTGIVLQVNSNPVLKATLQLGDLAETVNVVGSAPLVETRNPAIGGVIENKQIEALPLDGRNPVMLVMMAGAAADSGEPSSRSMTTSRGIAITGGQPFGVTYLLDGAMHNNVYDNFNLPLPFPDALQEFRVETSSQNAQNGIHGGGTVNASTKAGTNVFHGDLFEFSRHHRFNATSPFAGINPATGKRRDDGLVRNQFGGVLGGPIVKDRIFFFGAYQGTRATQVPADIVTFVPTAAMLAGDFTAVASAACNARGNITLAAPFVGNRIDPSQFSPAAVRIAGKLPAATDACGRIAYSRPTKPREGQSIGRIDWQVSQNQQLFGRYMATTTFWDPAYANTGNVLATTLGGRDSLVQSLALGDTMVLSSNVVNNIRVTVNRTNVHRTHAEFFGPEDVGINTYSYLPHYLLVSVTGAFTLGTGTETDSWYRPNTYSVADDFTMVRGGHQWGLGATYSYSDWHTRSNVRSPGPFTFDGAVTGLGMADFMLGRLQEFREAAPFVQDITQNYFGTYVQDTWKISSSMTMNYGARYEPWFPQEHQNRAIYAFDPARFRAGQISTVFTQAPPGFVYSGDEGFYKKAGMHPDWKNLLPRVGFAWDPSKSGRTSVRAGYGLNSDFIAGQFFFDAAQLPPFGLEVRNIRPNVGTFDDPWGGTGKANPFPITQDGKVPFGGNSPFISAPLDLKNTRISNWNVGIQQQFGPNIAASATYLGNHMWNVWGAVTGNPGAIPAGASATGPCTLNSLTGPQTFANCSTASLDLRREITQANPVVGQNIGYLDYVVDSGWQTYHGLLLSVQQRLWNGVSASANYTVSKCEGLVNQGGNPLNVATGYMLPVSLLNPPANAQAALDADKGPCDNSPTHIFNLTASGETPRFAATAARVLASGWRLSGIFRASSGDQLTVVSGVDRALTGNITVQRASQVLDNPYGTRSVNNWFNAAAFAQPALGTYGNSGRNAFVGMGKRVVDLSLVRSFGLPNAHRVEARIEAFNAFNWFRPATPTALATNLSPVTNLSSASFGRYLTSGDPRVLQFAMKYQF